MLQIYFYNLSNKKNVDLKKYIIKYCIQNFSISVQQNVRAADINAYKILSRKVFCWAKFLLVKFPSGKICDGEFLSSKPSLEETFDREFSRVTFSLVKL